MDNRKLLKSEVLYEDRFCKVTSREIKVYNYYFPFKTAKVLHMDEIEKVILKENLGFFEKKIWGMPCVKVFYALDCSRLSKTTGIWIKPKGSSIKIGLTPDSD